MLSKLCDKRREMAALGGRADSYEGRRRRRGSRRKNAPYWTCAAAVAALAVLDERCEAAGIGRGEQLWKVWTDASEARAFAQGMEERASQESREVADAVMGHHAGDAQGARDQRLVDRALKRVRDMAGAEAQVEEMKAPCAPDGEAQSLRDVLSAGEGDRRRRIEPNKRVRRGTQGWDLSWLDGPGVVCYERCVLHGRARETRLLQRAVRTQVLMTALRSPADHYLIVRNGESVEWMSVQEYARAYGLREESPLWHVLCMTETVTEVQAGMLFGNAVSVDVMRAIVRLLIEEGSIDESPTYASAFSGMDTIAEAVDAEVEGQIDYQFASEEDPVARRVLLSAWGERGLGDTRCHEDATRGAAVEEVSVDVWACTAECVKHTRRVRASRREAAAAFVELDRSLDYVRLRRPRVVILENVCDPLLAERVNAAVSRIGGYRWRRIELSPHVLGRAMERERAFWVGVAF